MLAITECLWYSRTARTVLAVLANGSLSLCLTGCPEGAGPEPDLDLSLLGCEWAAGGTGGDPDAEFDALTESPSFNNYLDAHVVALADGRWLVEGDILVGDYRLVVEGFRRFSAAQVDHGDIDDEFRATVACDLDLQIDQIWNPSDKLNLSYCLDRSWDQAPSLRVQAIDALERATLAWESAADVNFIAVENGPACSHASAKFVVRYQADSCLIVFGFSFCDARGLAFFPNAPAEQRALDLWLKAFQSGPTLDRVVSHELGHILGLWHEHARFPHTDPTCSGSSIEGGRARGVTDRDSDSVMGYPQCPGSDPVAPHPSALDRTGVELLYNLPRPILGGALAPSDASTLAPGTGPTTGIS